MSSGVLRGSVALVLVAACARPAPMHPVPGFTPEEEVHAPPAGTIALPAGARLDVHVDDALSTETSQPGDAFTATVLAPVRGPDGRVVVQEGAKIRGRVLSIEKAENGRDPSMRVLFENVDTTMGRRKLRATLASAVDGTVAMQPTTAGQTTLRDRAVGGGPPSPIAAPPNAATANEEAPDGADEDGEPAVVIPEGSVLELVLVQPLRT